MDFHGDQGEGVWNQRIHRNRKNPRFFSNQRQKLLRLLPKRNRVRKATVWCEFVVGEQVVGEGGWWRSR